ncbi:MAG: hypothetical protein MJZ20_03230 [Bacteroidaceae bacterium]|nr:hypothetical protein [Bacteroidaceae bacterium]
METADFIDLYMPSWLHGFQYPCAMIVCCAELTLGLLALKIMYRRIALFGMFALLSFFVWLTTVNAFFPTILGSVESCGCFGELIHFTPIASFIKSAILWLIVAVLLFTELKQYGFAFGIVKLKNSIHDVYVWISVAIGWILVLFSYFFVNRLNHDIYLPMYICICVISTIVIIRCGKEHKQIC